MRGCPFGSPPRLRPAAEFGLFLREDQGSANRCSLMIVYHDPIVRSGGIHLSLSVH